MVMDVVFLVTVTVMDMDIMVILDIIGIEHCLVLIF